MQPVNIAIQLERIHCYDEGDSLGAAEPFLWGVFFKIDGTTAFVDEFFQLQGTVQTFNTLGDHGNLGTTSVDAGDDITIPAQFGYGDWLVPIPLRTPVGETTTFACSSTRFFKYSAIRHHHPRNCYRRRNNNRKSSRYPQGAARSNEARPCA
ncbi:MAG TPA: hypothetical protein VJ124_25630 [Pyrinomonadaceae bacterium]|nr:hypothetical protein [Pyrinomonadaceae bacterium]